MEALSTKIDQHELNYKEKVLQNLTPQKQIPNISLDLNRNNSAFKTHIAERSRHQNKTLNLAESSQNIKYLPKKDKDSLVFYGTQKFYVFFRLFYTLYERILKAWELC